MTLIRTPTIPSEFIRFDSHVTDADQFFNVRDAQVARENLNILIARRLRRPLISVRCRNAGYTNTGHGVTGYGGLGYTSGTQKPSWFGPWRVWVPPFCKMLTIRMRAYASHADGDIQVFPMIQASGFAAATAASTNYSFTVTGTAEAEYEIDIPTPVSYSGSSHWHDLQLCYTCESYGISKGSHTVAWSEDRAVIATSGTLSPIGDQLRFSTPAATVEPQVVSSYSAVTVDGTTYYRFGVPQTWNVWPVAGDVFQLWNLSYLVVVSITVIPKAITDFGTVAGLT